jgi:hypothetical protein
MNLLMVAPLCDSRGKVRYFIGAQVDVSGLVKECSGLESFKRLVGKQANAEGANVDQEDEKKVVKDDFQELSEMLNLKECDVVRRHGARMHREPYEEEDTDYQTRNWNNPRLLIASRSPYEADDPSLTRISGRLRFVLSFQIVSMFLRRLGPFRMLF